MLLKAPLAMLLASSAASPVLLATFDGQDPETTQQWQNMDDPVMGGQSHSKYSIARGHLNFQGKCAVVPFLHAPGFCKVATTHGLLEQPHFPDASQFISGSLHIMASSKTPGYKGFRVGFGAKNATWPRPGMHHALPSFKANFSFPSTAATGVSTIKVPFDSFSVDWSEFTGSCSTKDPTGEQHVCCSAAHPEVCPTAQHLSQLTSLEIWAEGVEGDFDITVKAIAAGP